MCYIFNMKPYKLTFVAIIVFMLWHSVAFCYKTETHQAITSWAIEKSQLDYRLKQLGIPEGIAYKITTFKERDVNKWITYGSKYEDDFGLSWTTPFSANGALYNHFYNPVFGLGYYENEAGEIRETGQSLIFRMNDYIIDEFDFMGRNEWSYQTAREIYWAALTGDGCRFRLWRMRDRYNYSCSSVEGKHYMNHDERNQFLAWTFQAVGHMVHLIQDASVPAHTRNDVHADRWVAWAIKGVNTEPYEDWATNNVVIEDNDPDNNKFGGTGSDPWTYWRGYTLPTQNVFIDTNKSALLQSEDFDQGLAEYSYANFFSDDSMGSYDLPANDGAVFNETEIVGNSERTFSYIDSTNAGNGGVKHLALCGIIQKTQITLLTYVTYRETAFTVDDEKVHQDYAAKLIPRAIGYSAGFIDYFFRGTLEITASDTFVYGIIDGSLMPHEFTSIKLKVRNTTPDEPMQAGTIIAVAKYKKRIDYEEDLSTDPPLSISREKNYSYSVSSPIAINALSSDYPEGFTFDFTDNPIPAGITDLYLQVVFKGTLGNEQDIAVAVGMKDLNEPQHLVFWNCTDYFLLDGEPRKAEEIENDPDAASYGYIRPYRFTEHIGFSAETPDADTAYVAIFENLPPGRYGKLIVLTDTQSGYWVKDHVYSKPYNLFPDLILDNTTFTCTFSGLVNQTNAEGIWRNTPVYAPREVLQHLMTYFIRCYPIFVYDPYSIPAPDVEEGPFPATINFP